MTQRAIYRGKVRKRELAMTQQQTLGFDHRGYNDRTSLSSDAPAVNGARGRRLRGGNLVRWLFES